MWDNEPMSSDEASLQVDLAEFNALRAEIQTFITLQSGFLGLAVAIAAAVIPIAVGQPPETRRWIVAACPIPFAILAVLYADVVARIGRAATYIQSKLQPRLAKQTGSKDAFGWERYVHQEYPSNGLLWFTDKIRYPIFFLPGGIAWYANIKWLWLPPWWDRVFGIGNAVALAAAVVVAVASEIAIRRVVSTR
jgi:hypothetical protein